MLRIIISVVILMVLSFNCVNSARLSDVRNHSFWIIIFLNILTIFSLKEYSMGSLLNQQWSPIKTDDEKMKRENDVKRENMWYGPRLGKR